MLATFYQEVVSLATAIANANEHTKIVRITFVWGPRAGIMFLFACFSPNKSLLGGVLTWLL